MDSRSGNVGGVAGVVTYDPYFTRSLHAFKRVLLDGHPILVRLHAAAQYPASADVAIATDRVGHAVLIVGYDDERGALAVADPWDPAWGGDRAGVRWMSYAEFYTQIVDSSLGCGLVGASLSVGVVRAADGSGRLSVGFYVPEGIVMDQDTQRLTEVVVRVGSGSFTAVGEWPVGRSCELSIPAEALGDGARVDLDLEVVVAAERPYPFCDRLRMRVARAIEGRLLTAAGA